MSTEDRVILQQIAKRLALIEEKLSVPAHREKHIQRTGPAWNAKLNPEKVTSVRALLALGFSQHKVARVHNVSRAAIQAIAEGKTWRTVPLNGNGAVLELS